jgi:hypothetical protein
MVPPFRKVICPVYLNNKGVTLLDAGRCEDAALCFKRASKVMMAVIANERARIKDMNGAPIEPNGGDIPFATSRFDFFHYSNLNRNISQTKRCSSTYR